MCVCLWGGGPSLQGELFIFTGTTWNTQLKGCNSPVVTTGGKINVDWYRGLFRDLGGSSPSFCSAWQFDNLSQLPVYSSPKSGTQSPFSMLSGTERAKPERGSKKHLMGGTGENVWCCTWTTDLLSPLLEHVTQLHHRLRGNASDSLTAVCECEIQPEQQSWNPDRQNISAEVLRRAHVAIIMHNWLQSE